MLNEDGSLAVPSRRPGEPLAARSTSPRRRLRSRLLFLSPDEVRFSRRGFRCDSAAVRERLEEVGTCFVQGFNSALEEDRPDPLAERLEAIPLERRGFAYEGAGMALTILDALTLRRQRLRRFLEGPADRHVYITHIGAGWALARLPLSPPRLLARLDPILRWLALDGYGFHEGFFHWPHSVVRQRVPRKVRGYARRAFDQGLGRSLWFVEGAEPERIHDTISGFPASRRGDLWSGVGLAAAYAGGRSRADLERLLALAAAYAPQLAQGTVFAAATRVRAGNPAPHTEMACQALCGTSAELATRIFQQTGLDLPPDGEVTAFEAWRLRIQGAFAERGTTR